MNVFKERSITPPPDRTLIAYCPRWSSEGYQVCRYDERGFYYDGQPNDAFNNHVTHWDFLCEIE